MQGKMQEEFKTRTNFHLFSFPLQPSKASVKQCKHLGLITRHHTDKFMESFLDIIFSLLLCLPKFS